MSLANRIASLLGYRPVDRPQVPVDSPSVAVRANAPHEVLDPQNENNPYWAKAGPGDADSTTTPAYRKEIRERARLEVNNNSYARGMTLTLANDTIGKGPRLQILMRDFATAEQMHRRWSEWSEEVNLADKLQTMKLSKTVDGEAFGIMTTNPKLENQIKLDFRLYEADYFQTPWDYRWFHTRERNKDYFYDGLEFDRHNNPLRYWKTKHHPGSVTPWMVTALDFESVPAKYVVHLYRRDRPGQSRGVCEIVSVLDLYADLRDYSDAALEAAAQAARMSVVLQTDMPPGSAAEFSDTQCVKIPIPKGSMLNAPDGWKAYQLKAEQPVDTFDKFKKEIVSEIGRCLNMPYAVAAGDSSDHNYASGRMDWQVYDQSIAVERKFFERHALNRIFWEWFAEAETIPGYLPDLGESWRPTWIWDGRPYVDPEKEANAATDLFDKGLMAEVFHWAERYGITIYEAFELLSWTTEERRTRGLPQSQNLVTELTQMDRSNVQNRAPSRNGGTSNDRAPQTQP